MSNLVNPYKTYVLNLSDENNWYITCDEKNIQMLDKLAVIMNLKECRSNDYPKLIFSKMSEDKNIASDAVFSMQSLSNYNIGWKYSDFIARGIRIWHHPSIGDVVCEINSEGLNYIEYLNMCYSLLPIYNRSVNLGGIPFHAGLAEINRHGVLFVGSGGMGKSTCCRRLPNYWKPLCDDETLVVLNNKKEYWAHPFPTWSEYLTNRSHKTWDVQYSVPLSAIFFLEQANNDEVISLTIRQASALITESASQAYIYSRALVRSREDIIELRRKLFNNAFNLAMNIPAFYLCVCLNGKFWEKIEEVMSL
jgi:SynChlorMet cassette protein ScmC